VSKEQDIETIGLTGAGNGRLEEEVDVSVVVPSENTRLIQEGHISVGHVLVELVERRLFETQKDAG
jgi:D-sedoheptulose 7-phosphate isomerase